MSITGKIRLMTTFIFATLLALIMLYAVNLDKTYKRAAGKEIGRQARQGDEVAKRLYQAISYGITLQIFLWLIIIASGAGSFVLFAELSSAWLAFILIAATLGLGFWWVPPSKAGAFSRLLASWSAKPISRLMHYLYPVLRPLSKLVSSHYPVHIHSGLYEKEDLLELIEWQSAQEDNRILPVELKAAEQALKFTDKLVGDIITPLTKVYKVSANDTVGPVLMDDLHKSGHSIFPVYKDKKSHVVGMLYLQDLLKVQAGGTVAKYMRSDIQYLHEDYSLYQALPVLLCSSQRLYVVINSRAEFVGIVTAKDILEQVVGKLDTEEVSAYDNPQVVASSLLAEANQPQEKADSQLQEVV